MKRTRPNFDFGMLPQDGILKRMLTTVRQRLDSAFGAIWEDVEFGIGEEIRLWAGSIDSDGHPVWRGKSYTNWVIADGRTVVTGFGDSITVPDLLTSSWFLRTGATYGATGGSDSSAHTHSVDVAAFTGTSGSEASHTHSVDVAAYTGDSGSEASHTHAVTHDHASTTSSATADAGYRFASGVYDGITYNHTHTVDLPSVTVTSDAGSSHLHTINHDHGAVTSAAGSSHAHSIDHDHPSVTSGAASATDNKPAYKSVVPIVRIG